MEEQDTDLATAQPYETKELRGIPPNRRGFLKFLFFLLVTSAVALALVVALKNTDAANLPTGEAPTVQLTPSPTNVPTQSPTQTRLGGLATCNNQRSRPFFSTG